MNKTQIRLILDKEGIKVSTTKIGEVAVSLGFGDNVDRRYSDFEAKQILDAIRQDYQSKQQQKADGKGTEPAGDRPTQSAPDATAALAKVAQFREQTSTALGNEVVLAQQNAVVDLQRFEQSAQATAQAIAQRKALVVASFPSLVDQHAVNYLNQINELVNQSQQGFATTADLNEWVESWTNATLPTTDFTLPGKTQPKLTAANS